MFEYKHYVPVLKAKEGEYRALQETTVESKNLMTPLLEITSIPWDFVNEIESTSIDEHLNKVGEKINTSWGVERRIFIESNYLDGNTVMLDGTTHHLTFLFDDFRRLNLLAVPVTSIDKHPNYKTAVKAINVIDKRGICIRLNSHDIIRHDLSQIIIDTIAYYELTPAEIDLIIDLKSIDENSIDLALYTVTNVINNTLPHIMDWRSLTVCGSSFPVNLSDIPANTIATINRVEWLFWNNLIAGSLKRKPAFGDYTIAHWDVIELDPRIITMSANIRYTCDSYWLIVKGRSVKLEAAQHYNLCASLIARAEYVGTAFSWADNYINECAARRVGPGNSTIWRKVGCNHHLQKVVTQLSTVV